MNDFNDILGTVDGRLIAALDRQYQAEECSFAETKPRKRHRQDNEDLYINQSYRHAKVITYYNVSLTSVNES